MEPFIAALATIGPVLYVLGAAALLDVITGVWAAFQSGTLNAEFLPTFFTSNILKKVVPIAIGLAAGFTIAATNVALAVPVITVAGTAAAAYLASVVGSIADNIGEGQTHAKSVPTSVALNAAVTPVAPPMDNVTVTNVAAVANDADKDNLGVDGDTV